MAQVIVRNLENDLKLALEERAQRHGWSMEEEVRQILRRAVNEEPAAGVKLGSRIAARFADIGLDRPLPELKGHNY